MVLRKLNCNPSMRLYRNDTFSNEDKRLIGEVWKKILNFLAETRIISQGQVYLFLYEHKLERLGNEPF